MSSFFTLSGLIGRIVLWAASPSGTVSGLFSEHRPGGLRSVSHLFTEEEKALIIQHGITPDDLYEAIMAELSQTSPEYDERHREPARPDLPDSSPNAEPPGRKG